MYRIFPISFSHRVTLIDLVDLDMLDFDVILGMDRLNACYASLDYMSQVVRFRFPNESIVEWKGKNTINIGKIMS